MICKVDTMTTDNRKVGILDYYGSKVLSLVIDFHVYVLLPTVAPVCRDGLPQHRACELSALSYKFANDGMYMDI